MKIVILFVKMILIIFYIIRLLQKDDDFKIYGFCFILILYNNFYKLFNSFEDIDFLLSYLLIRID